MKPYLLAPIAIAGLITVAGTASIATTEMNLLKTGRDAVASMRFEKSSPIAIRDTQWMSDSSGDALVTDLKSEIGSGMDEYGAAMADLPAPEATVEADPIGEKELTACEKEQMACERAQIACEKEKAACEKAKKDVARARVRKVELATIAPKAIPAAPEAPKGMLTSSYAFAGVPAESKKFTMMFGADKDGKLVRLAGVAPKSFRMVFDSKKFTAFKSDFAKGQKIEWKALSAEEIKQLKKYGVDVKVQGFGKDQIPQTITIDPVQAATAAAGQVGFAALNDNDNENDPDIEITTSSK